jgi:hypothetical protein
MVTLCKHLLTSVATAFCARQVSRRSGRAKGRCLIEALEDRLLLSNDLLWIGPKDGSSNWSYNKNWVILGTGGNAVPTNGDSVVFSTMGGPGGVQGQNTDSTDDIAGLKLAEVNLLDRTFTSKITLTQDLTITSQFLMNTGTITATNNQDNVTVQASTGTDPAPTVTWDGGTINAVLNLGTAGATNNPSTTISGTVTYKDFGLYNEGYITWNGSTINIPTGTIFILGTAGIGMIAARSAGA